MDATASFLPCEARWFPADWRRAAPGATPTRTAPGCSPEEGSVLVGTYEIVAVLRPDLDEEGLGAALERITQRITEHGGALKSQERWGKRKLAFPIRKHRDGYYALLVFTLDPGRSAALRQMLGLNEDLLRFAFSTHHPKPAAAAAPAAAAPAAPPASPSTSGAPVTGSTPAAGHPSAPPAGSSHV